MSLDGELAALRSLAAKTLINVNSGHLALGQADETLQSLIEVIDTITTDLEAERSPLKNDLALQQRCGVLVNLCHASLTKLCDSIRDSSEADTAEIEKLGLSQSLHDDINDAQRELLMRYTDIAEFVSRADMARKATMERDEGSSQEHEQEVAILEAVDKILTDESISRDHSSALPQHHNEQSALWKHLREKLKLSGFKASDVERHKTSIFHKLHESLHVPQVHRPALLGTSTGQSRTLVYAGAVQRTEQLRGYPPPRTFQDHAHRHPANRYSNYRPPAASTIYDDSDDDAISLTSEASTLLAPVDDRHPHDQYTLRSPTIVRPSSRGEMGRMAEPRSPRLTFEVPDEKIMDLPGSPREAQFNGWPTLNQPLRNRPAARAAAPMPRPVSPRQRDQRYHPVQRQPSYTRSTSTNPKYDYDVLIGRRSAVNPVWKYKRNGDMYPARNQSMDVQDDALPTAAADGRIDEVQRLLWDRRNIESFGSRNEQQSRGFERTTALYRAAMQGHFEIVHLLLRSGANPNPRRRDGKSLVRLLADEGSVEMLRMLLEYRADVQNQGALPQAALFGHFNVVQLLLEYGADIDEVEKQTALYRASSNGYPQIVELLLREGADVHYTTSTGHSALYKAVQNENHHCARLLLSYGARPNVGTGRTGDTVLHVASDVGHEPTVRALLRRGALANECNGYQNAIAINGRRRFPIHFAARNGHIGTAKLLLDYGANINAETDDGRSPVDIAIERDHHEMVDLLSRMGGFPRQPVHDRRPSSRGQDDDPRHSSESQLLRRFSSSLPERPRRLDRRTSGLQSARSFEEDQRHNRSSTGSRQTDSTTQQPRSSTSRLNTTAAVSLLASSLMLIGGG